MIDQSIRKAVRAIRPGSNASADTKLNVLIGWYARKGAAAAARGFFRRITFGHVDGVLFLGRNVRVDYPRRARFGRNVSIGSGALINAFSTRGIFLDSGVTLRENSWIQCSSSPADPGAGLSVGNGTYIGPGAILGVGGQVSIGSACQIGAGFIIVAENHIVAINSEVDPGRVSRVGISIGDRCWIGHRVTILDGVTLGDECVVGAGAVVTSSFPSRTKIAGVPARMIGRVSE